MTYIPHSTKDIDRMVAEIGLHSIDALFDTIPASLVLDDDAARKILSSGSLDWDGMDEMQLARHVERLARQNKVYPRVFTGAGSYNHYIPAVVDQLAARGEFWTAYTPYQAEMSQGYLQAIFEYQSMMAGLTGMTFSNASLHDGATALADAVIMAQSVTRKRDKVLLAGVPNPIYTSVLETTLETRNIAIEPVPISNLHDRIDDRVMAVVTFSPDFWGNVHDVRAIVQGIKARDASIVTIQCIAEAMSLGLLTAPGDAGIDIAVGDAQSFGIPPCFGGPSLGFITVNDVKVLHKMPGRVVGLTKELHGEGQGFTLTLQAREQHIRRERALSNICSNEALNMLRAAIYLAAVGATGLRQVATINARKANWLKRAINSIDGYDCINDQPTFNEFVVRAATGTVARLLASCEEKGMLGPLDLGKLDGDQAGLLLFCVTELIDDDALDLMVTTCKEAVVP